MENETPAQDAADRRPGPTALYQAAWHGSPHQFAEFSLAHVGGGEGAQAYGWGLYFSQDRGVADGYRARLSRGHHEYVVGADAYRHDWGDLEWHDQNGVVSDPAKRQALRELEYRHGDKAKAIEGLRDDLHHMDANPADYPAASRQRSRDAIAWLEGNEVSAPTPGQIYHVDIPDDDVLLDEDKPFKEQPEKVKAAIRAVIAEGQAKARAAGNLDFWAARMFNDLDEMSGGKIYWSLESLYNDDAKAVSLALNQHGVKGITYDGRSDGRCFVIFDDKAISTLGILYQIIGEQGAERLAAAREAQEALENQRDRGAELLDALRTAKDMDESGPLFSDPKAIRLTTGWEKGADGKWRYEIPDFKLRPGVQFRRDDWFHGRKAQRTTLGELLDAPELFAAYPTLAKATVAFMRLSNDTLGSYLREKDEILLTSSYLATQRRTQPATTADIRPEVVATLIHEIQHAIQLREGFAQGSNTSRSYQGVFRRHAQEEYVRERERITAR